MPKKGQLDSAALLAAAERVVRHGNPDSIEELRKTVQLFNSDHLCVFCKLYRANLYCDFIIGLEMLETKDGIRLTGIEAEQFTCDMPICENCRTQGATIFACGKKCEAFAPDYCPIHAEKHEESEVNVITKAEATAWRNSASMMVAECKPHLVRAFANQGHG